ncbi:uncharacterized protein BP01DRAFT_370097 [Aspergillus saccharolyticus JOP 1030-1]|uniref:Uncharacterized protein n=1 Tax=Aspergillus saccharolyticus JOP 1030-1 TaxID=1450539 RepID=A0A318ZIV9_9EURO|nr:hypothetical protein BP01DRAFT_370097 [Aspergillus saccharolyticus JOP 1030-1]PYH40188.1 hypothetical protein BP01DRAFT_370097 [Aspergillus saccharolyticus JOP 1030-1]
MSSSQDSFIANTSPDPYDQIIVLSQKVINAGFNSMWKLAQGDDESPLTHFHKSIHGESIDATVGPPSVQLHVESHEPMLYFLLALKTGTIILYKSQESDDTISLAVNNWVLAFNVVINQKKITKDSDEYKQFKERAGLPESNFSLAQLFIDSSSSTKFNVDLSNTGDTKLDDLSGDSRASLLTFIDHWIKGMSENGKNILGWSAQREHSKAADELNPYAPSFPPTSIDYFCYPWRGTNGQGSNQDNQDDNALSYLLMSDFKNPPAEGAIAYTGPWVDHASGRDASFCMSRTLFWGWMLPLVRQVVVAMTPMPDKPYVEYVGTPSDTPWSFGARYHVGDSGASDSDYQWVPNGNNGWSTSTADKSSSSGKVVKPGNGNDWETAEEQATKIQATAAFDAGKESLTVKGSSKFAFQLNHHRDGMSPTDFWVDVFSSWELELNMTSIEEGGIVFRVNDSTDHVSVTYDYGGGMKLSRTAKDIADGIAERLKDSMNGALNDVSGILAEAMANANRLCLPAAGTFFMKDPLFNQSGDLLVKLAYDGADPPPPPSKGKYRFRPPTLNRSVRRVNA